MTASKKKKEKARDFAKATFKLGKAKQKAANVTNTSFSSRSIALSHQSIARDNTGIATTKRNLTLDDLQTHLKHYSAGTRKDALAGLKELLSAHRGLWQSSVGTLVPLLARMIGDEEASVRKALLAFFEWYLPALPPIVLQPHHSVLLFFATSSMSHIFPDIRLDAVRALNIFLTVFPESIALPWWNETGMPEQRGGEEDLPNKVLECYLALLHIRSGIASNGLKTDMSPGTKALVLSSLATYMRLSTAPEGPADASAAEDRVLPEVPTWFMTSAFPTRRAYESFLEQVQAVKADAPLYSHELGMDHSTQIASTSLLDQETLLALANISDIYLDLSSSNQSPSNSQDLPKSPAQLLKTLLPILISAFLDSGPTAFSPEASATPTTTKAMEAALTTVTAVAELTRDLWRATLAQQLQEAEFFQDKEITAGLEKLVVHMAAYFPFAADELSKRSTAESSKLQNLNVSFCELVALVGMAAQPVSAATLQAARKAPRPSKGKLNSATLSMSNFVSSLLSSSSRSIITSSASITPQLYAQLLPTIWSLLSSSDLDDSQQDILNVLLRHFLDLSASSGVKKLAFTFMSRLLVLPDISPATRLLPCGQRIQKMKETPIYAEFLLSLPRYLWELGSRDEDLSHRIFMLLRHAIIAGDVTDALVEKLAAYLAPYFFTNHPKKGALPGPWTKLQDDDLAQLAVQVVWWFPENSVSHQTLANAIAAAEPLRTSMDLSID